MENSSPQMLVTWHLSHLLPTITQITPKLSCAARDGVMVSGEDLEPVLSGTQKKSHMLG